MSKRSLALTVAVSGSLLAILFFSLLSCGQYSESYSVDQPAPEGSGGVSARLVFPSNAAVFPRGQRAQPLGLDLTGVVDTVLIYASTNGTVVASASFAYTAHSGALLGIPAGGNYLIGVDARDQTGRTLFHSSKSGISVEREWTKNIGELYMIRTRTLFVLSGEPHSWNSNSTQCFAVADFDGDGDPDLVQGTPAGDVSHVYRNMAGRFTTVWGSLNILGDTRAIAVGHLGDSVLLPDVLEGNDLQENRVTLSRSDGSFAGTSASFGSSTSPTRAIALGDLDGDTDLDVAEGHSSLNLYLNYGNGVISAGNYLGGLGGDIRSLAMGDVNGDGDLDIAIGKSSGQNSQIMQNNGSGSISTLSSLPADYTSAVVLADLDSDGDLDLIEGNEVNRPNKVFFNRNINSGLFSDSGQTLGSYTTTSLAAGDLDLDGDVDFVEGTNGQGVRIWLNNGSGVFTQEFPSIGDDSLVTGVAVADVDGDGDPDIIEGVSDRAFRIWLNTSNFQVSAQGQFNNYATRAIVSGDLDRDGDIDFIQGVEAWPNPVWLNDGTGMFYTSGPGIGTFSTYAMALGDLDGDVDLDLFEGNGGGNQPNHVYLNNGNGLFSDTTQLLGNNYTFSLVLGDLDGDRDLDALEGIYGGGNLVWFNDGVGTFAAPGPGLGSSSTFSVILGDLDGDADLDLFEGISSVPGKAWFNDGTGSFVDSGQFLGSNVFSAATGDLDGDGDLDLVQGVYYGPILVLLNAGNGTFQATSQNLGETNSGTINVKIGDIDGDGDLDIVEGRIWRSNLIWYNDGSALFSSQAYAPGDTLGTLSLDLADADGDGTLDIIEGSFWRDVPPSGGVRVYLHK